MQHFDDQKTKSLYQVESMHGSTTGFFCRATRWLTLLVLRHLRQARPGPSGLRSPRTNRSSSSGPTCSRMCGRASRGHRARCRPGEPHGPVRAARHVVSGRKPCRVTAAWCICTRRKPDQASAYMSMPSSSRTPARTRPGARLQTNWVTACRHARTGLCRRLYHRKPSWAAA